jgi:CubicO group peptidase (beta-lactamase class C family)
MMVGLRRCVRIVIAMLAMLAAGSAGAEPPPSPPVDIAQLSAALEKARQDWGVPGLSVAIVKDGQAVLAKGYGVREIGKPEPVDADTLFAIASNTKAFTAAALAMLEEEKKLGWNDRVQQHLPWLQLYDPYVSSDLRLDDLLCHRTGLKTFSGDLLWWGTAYTPEDMLRRARYLKPTGAFRAQYGYSNLMYVAAGEVVAKASGTSWVNFVSERILKPVGMSRTVTSVKDLAATGNFASPHKTTREAVTAIPWANWDNVAAAGGLISSANDMAKWVRVQLDRGRVDDATRLFSEDSSRRMWSPQTILPLGNELRQRYPSMHFRTYGLGWGLTDYKGRLSAAHGGGYDGMVSYVLLVPEEKLGIVVLTNSLAPLPVPVANHIRDEYLGGEKKDWFGEGLEQYRKNRTEFEERIQRAITPAAEGTQPSRDLDAYTGKFTCPMYGDAIIVKEGETLVLRLLPNEQLVADLKHLHYDTWVIHWRQTFAWFADGTLQFVPDARGDFQQLRLDVPNDDLWFDEPELKRNP